MRPLRNERLKLQKWFLPKSRMRTQKVTTAEITCGTGSANSKRLHLAKSRFFFSRKEVRSSNRKQVLHKERIAFRKWLLSKARWATREHLRPMAKLGLSKWPVAWGQSLQRVGLSSILIPVLGAPSLSACLDSVPSYFVSCFLVSLFSFIIDFRVKIFLFSRDHCLTASYFWRTETVT